MRKEWRKIKMVKKWKKKLIVVCSALILAVSPILAGATGSESTPEQTTTQEPPTTTPTPTTTPQPTTTPEPTTTRDWYGPDSEDMGSASLVVADNTTPTGQNGKDMEVRITLKNLGDGVASNVTIRPVVKTGADSPFEPKNVGLSTIRRIREDGGTGTATFMLTVKEKAVTGYYSVDYNVVYYDEGSSTNRSITVTSYVFIEGLDEEESSTQTDINISLRNSPTPSSSSFNCPIKFDLFLNNFGVSDAYSVTIAPVISAKTSEYPFEIEEASYERALPSPLLGTKSQSDEVARNQVVHYSLNVRNDVTTGYYPVVFKIAAKDENGKEYKTEQTIFFNIKGNPEYEETTTETTTQEETSTKVSVPRLIITGYETNLDTVNAGDSFQLTIHVKNTSAITPVSNVKFTLSATEDSFLPVSGSSTLFINRIGIGQTVDLTIEMTAKASLEAKSYPLTLEAEYEDDKLNPYTAKENISIPVSQEIRMSIGEIEVMPSSLEIGNQANIMFPVNNMGKSKIFNVSITFEGDTVTGGESFKGNVDSGATANVDVMLTAAAATMDDPTVYAVVTYEDDKGKQYSMKKSFELYISESYIPEEPDWSDMPVIDDMPTEDEKSLPKWAIPAAGAFLVVAVIVIVVIIVKKKRKKAEGMDDDEIL